MGHIFVIVNQMEFNFLGIMGSRVGDDLRGVWVLVDLRCESLWFSGTESGGCLGDVWGMTQHIIFHMFISDSPHTQIFLIIGKISVKINHVQVNRNVEYIPIIMN